MTTTLSVGNLTIHRLVEQEAPLFDAHTFFPSLTSEMRAENRSWLEPRYIDAATGKVVLCIQSYLVRTPHHNIMIDTCVGNHKPRPTRDFWHMMNTDRYAKALAGTGLGVGDIDYVMCTHLHVDHTGWNTRLENGRWVPTFPKAKYVFADRELAFWTERHKQAPEACPWVNDSVLPIVEARRTEIVKSDHQLNDHVCLLPTPGHTIDHFSVLVGQGRGNSGHDAVITGDMMHSPLQVRYPELGMMSDYDSKQAGETRRKFFDRFADTSTLICTAHFPSPSVGRFVSAGDAFKFVET
jgi:glyoxylase-like metal-dependent hydrolase (beta-lactamase superfamily II)